MVLPYAFIGHTKVILEILALSLFRHYETIFGYSLIVINSVNIIISVIYYKNNRNHHYWTFNLYALSQLIETIFFLTMGLYCTDSQSWKENEFFVDTMIFMICAWVILAVIVTILEIIVIDTTKNMRKPD